MGFRYSILNIVGLEKAICTERLNHHGIVAALCYDLSFVEGINKRMGSSDPQLVM